jgi:hypothetical protein
MKLLLPLLLCASIASAADIHITAGMSNTVAQNVINGSLAGDTINFMPGRHAYTNIRLWGNRTYYSNSDATIASTNAYAFKLGGPGIIISKLKFDGPAVSSFESVAGGVSGLVIDSCDFTGANQSTAPPGVSEWSSIAWNWAGKLVNAKITNNYGHDIGMWTMLYGYGWDNVEIANLTCKNRINPQGTQGEGRVIKLFGAGANAITYPEGAPNEAIGLVCRKLWVHDVTIDKYRGMGIEYQDGSDGDIWEDISIVNPIYFGSNWLDNRNVFAASLVAARNRNCTIRRLYITSNNPPNKDCFRVGIEDGGYNTQITDCYLEGPMGVSIGVNGSNASGSVSNNKLVNCPGPYNNGGNRANAALINNGPSVQLTWDTNRAFRGSTLAGAAPAPIPIPVPIPTAFTFTAKVQSLAAEGRIDVTTSNVPTGTVKIAADIEATGNPADTNVGPTPQTFSATDKFTVVKIHPGWGVRLKLRAFNANGGTLAVSAPQEFVTPGDSSVAWNKDGPVTSPTTQPTPAPTDDVAALKAQLQSVTQERDTLKAQLKAYQAWVAGAPK